MRVLSWPRATAMVLRLCTAFTLRGVRRLSIPALYFWRLELVNKHRDRVKCVVFFSFHFKYL